MSERQVIRCGSCDLNQFMTTNGSCRRCRRPFRVRQAVMATPEPSKGTRDAGYDIGATLALLRWAFGMSLRDVEARCGVRRQNMWKFENYRVMPSLRNIERMARVFGLSLSGFMQFAMHLRNARAQ